MATQEQSARPQTTGQALQEQWFPDGLCFGCGPANPNGFRLRSFRADSGVVAEWQPEAHHQAGIPVVAGGVLGTLLDCHTGAAVLMTVGDRDGKVPYVDGDPWVTLTYRIDMIRPTMVDHLIELRAWVDELDEARALARGEVLGPDGVTASITADWRRLPPRS